jgi:hypothetical protein
MCPMVMRLGAAVREDVLHGNSKRSRWNGKRWEVGEWKRVA